MRVERHAVSYYFCERSTREAVSVSSLKWACPEVGRSDGGC